MSRSRDTPPAAVAVGDIHAAADLTRFQRMLLGADGTVTSILEAYAGEPVEVLKLLQAFETATEAQAELGLGPGDRALRRRALLRGRHSRRNLLYAETIVMPDRVEPALLEGLLGTDKPLGALLVETRAETFREILAVHREPSGPTGAHFGIGPEGQLMSRTYRILQGGRPVILVTEKFPASSFRTVPA
ncbi:MAG: chorismate pyruvate-lyase family protein [Actinomycetota bacterium]|nr:chorismate pyruvate-lyase family protein [Actinomycetota bacterium]